MEKLIWSDHIVMLLKAFIDHCGSTMMNHHIVYAMYYDCMTVRVIVGQCDRAV